jgi:hypothetical protein
MRIKYIKGYPMPKGDFFFSKGNHKLSKDILIWNLPRLITCPGAGECKDWCYEKKIERMYLGAVASRMRNYKFSQQKGWWIKVIKYLEGRPEHYVRIHESGDFYSRRYFQDWLDIITLSRGNTFYAYTKSFKILSLKLPLPSNLILFQSYGSNNDDLINPNGNTARVLDDRMVRHRGEKLCPYHKADFTKCGESCSYCMTKPNKVKHVAFRRH